MVGHLESIFLKGNLESGKSMDSGNKQTWDQNMDFSRYVQ